MVKAFLENKIDFVKTKKINQQKFVQGFFLMAVSVIMFGANKVMTVLAIIDFIWGVNKLLDCLEPVSEPSEVIEVEVIEK